MKILVMFVLIVGLGLGSVITEEPKDFPNSVKIPTKRNTKNESVDVPTMFRSKLAPEGKFPFAIYLFDAGVTCTGSLIKLEWVLYAAHCVASEDPAKFDYALRVAIGGGVDVTPFFENTKSNLIVINIIRRYVHPAYRFMRPQHDMAIAELEKPFVSPQIKTIPLAFEKMKGPMYCTALGWGLNPPYPVDAKLKYEENFVAGVWPDFCASEFPYSVCVRLNAKKSGTCFGDSGGPLVCDGKVWGVLSRGGGPKEGCLNKEFMLYDEVYADLNWISGVTGVTNRGRRTVSSLEDVFASVCCVWLVALNGGTRGL